MVTTSKKFALDWLDAGKGFLVAALSSGLAALYNVLANAGVVNWKTVGLVALTSGVGYLIKNYLTPSQIVKLND